MIRKMTFHESGTGSRAEGDCRLVPRPWKQPTFLESRIPFLDILSAYFAIVVDLPDNFLNPRCPYKSRESLFMTSPYELSYVRPSVQTLRAGQRRLNQYKANGGATRSKDTNLNFNIIPNQMHP